MSVSNGSWLYDVRDWTTVNFTSLRTCVSVMRVRKSEACSESCGNNWIMRTLMHHARSKRSEINSSDVWNLLSCCIINHVLMYGQR